MNARGEWGKEWGGGGLRNAEPVKVVWQQVCLRIHFDVVYLMSLSIDCRLKMDTYYINIVKANEQED